MQLGRVAAHRLGAGAIVDLDPLVAVVEHRGEIADDGVDQAADVAGATSSVSWPASSRASRSRSFTSRSMRSVCRMMMARNRWRSSASDVALRQRLDVAADRGQRRAQLVRDVGDEVAADLIGAPQVGDVVQHEHGAVRAVGAAGAARAMIVRDGSRGGDSSSPAGVRPASAAATRSAIAGCRMVST